LTGRWLLWCYGLVVLLALILFGRVNFMAGLFLGTWVPVPIILVGWRLGSWWAALLALVGALLVLALSPGAPVLQANLGLWLILLLGLLLTMGHRRGWSEGSAIIGAVAVLGGLGLVFFLGQAFFQGLTPAALWDQKSQALTGVLGKLLSDAGMSFSDLRLMGLPRLEAQSLLVQVLPALVLINIAMVAWVNILVVQRLATLWGWEDLGEPLSHWASPEWLVFLLVAAGFALLAPIPWVGQAGLNLLLVMGFIYFCQGMAVIAALLLRYQLPWVLRALVYILAFMNPLLLVVIILGLTDLWLDYRTLQSPRET
jgi:uncharacterized protein YybS (DUF2232 family)